MKVRVSVQAVTTVAEATATVVGIAIDGKHQGLPVRFAGDEHAMDDLFAAVKRDGAAVAEIFQTNGDKPGSYWRMTRRLIDDPPEYQPDEDPADDMQSLLDE